MSWPQHRRLSLAVVVAASALVVAVPARATAGGGVVLQSYGGEVPDEAAYLLTPFLDELDELGFTAKIEDVSAALEASLSQPPRFLGKAEIEDIRVDIEEGYQAWLSLKLERASSGAGVAVDRLLASSEALSRNVSMRESLMRGLVTVALSAGRLGNDDKALEMMKTAIRYFPERDVSRVQYGPEAWQHYRAAKDALGEDGLLRVEIGAGEISSIFINGRFVSTTGPVTQHLASGTYRVFVQLAAGRGRVHLATVTAGETTTVRVEPFLDSVLETDDFAGFHLPDEVLRARHETALARSVGAALAVDRVVTVGVRSHRGERSVVATLLATDGEEVLRTLVLPLDDAPSAADLRRLARTLVLGASEAGDAAEVITLESEPAGSFEMPWPWLAVGAGGASLAAGVVLIAIDGDSVDDGRCVESGDPCPELRATMTPGIAASVAGAALIGLGVYLWARDDDPSAPALAILPLEGGGAMTIAGRF